MEHSFMYQLGYTVGYLIGVVGVLIAFGTVASFLLLPLVALFFPDKLILHWKKRVGRVLAWGFTTLPLDEDQNQEQKEVEARKESDERDNSESDQKPTKRDSEDVVLIYVAGVPIEIPRSVAPGHRPVAH